MTSRHALPANPFRIPERALPPQTRLDDVEIERVLAQSSFGIVYRGYDHSLKLLVAVKEYLPDALALRSAETQVVLRARSFGERFALGLQAFVAEAQTLARCDHPSLLRILRVMQRNGTAYRVMRYSPGPTLLEHRRSLAAPPPEAAMHSWLDALLGALEALCGEGCVHGAVSPGNILLQPGGQPVLLDFDAVRGALISDRTQSMMAALEPCFQPVESREPAAGLTPGPWTDLYALAATLHFCIGGQLPPPPGGPAQAFEPIGDVWRRLKAGSPGLGEAPPWLPALDSCLAELPRDRPQSAAQFRRMLGTAGAPRPAAAVATAMIDAAAAPEPPPAEPAAQAGSDQVIADLDHTFAKVAAQAQQDAAQQQDAAPPPDATQPPQPAAAAAATEPGAADPQAQAVPPPARRWRLAGAAAALVLGISAAWWAAGSGDRTASGAAAAPQLPLAPPPPFAAVPPVWQPRGASAPAQPLEPVKAVDSDPAPKPPPRRTAESTRGAQQAKAKPAASPRELCGERTQFALYQCMQTQCAKPAWVPHAQCVRLRQTDALD